MDWRVPDPTTNHFYFLLFFSVSPRLLIQFFGLFSNSKKSCGPRTTRRKKIHLSCNFTGLVGRNNKYHDVLGMQWTKMGLKESRVFWKKNATLQWSIIGCSPTKKKKTSTTSQVPNPTLCHFTLSYSIIIVLHWKAEKYSFLLSLLNSDLKGNPKKCVHFQVIKNSEIGHGFRQARKMFFLDISFHGELSDAILPVLTAWR